MILVTVGTHTQPFDRLIKVMDEVAADLDEQVNIQYGCSTYKLRFAEGFAWTTGQKMEEITEQARVVVAHAAAGAIIMSLKHKKPMIIVPRLRRYGEVIDDHQTQLAAAMANDGRAIALEQIDKEGVLAALKMLDRVRVSPPGSDRLVRAVGRIIMDWDKEVVAGKR